MAIDQLELGALIRKRRKELGLTLSDIADENISVPTISNIERGAVAKVSDEKLTYIMERLGLTTESLAEMRQTNKKERRDLSARLSTARHLIQLKLYDEARRELSALEKEDGIDDYPYYSTSVQLQKGVLYRKLGQWERAKRTLQNAIRLAQEADLDPQHNVVAEAYYFLSLCTFYGDQDYETAIEYADSALEAFQEDEESLFLKGQILYDKANYFFHLGRYGQSYKYVMEAQAISRKIHDIRALIHEYNLEGLILSEQKMYDGAIQIFQKAIDLSRKYYFVPDTASLLYLNLGDIYYRSASFDKAIQHFDIAHKLCQITKDQDLLAILYFSYGEIYYETNDLEKANSYVSKATELAKKFELTSEYLQYLVLKAKIKMKGHPEEAEKICQEGIRLSDKTKLYDKKKEFHFILAKYYDEHGREEQFAKETENMFHVENLIKGGNK